MGERKVFKLEAVLFHINSLVTKSEQYKKNKKPRTCFLGVTQYIDGDIKILLRYHYYLIAI